MLITFGYDVFVLKESRNSVSTSNTPPQFNPMVKTLLNKQGLNLFISFFT